MPVKPRKPIEPPSPSEYSYARVETALARVYGAEHVQRTAFRGRIAHFRKLGIPTHNPGKGARIDYKIEDVWMLMFSLELAEFGLDPKLIVEFVKHHWTETRKFYVAVWKAIEFRVKRGEDIFIEIPVNAMSWTWIEKLEETETRISYQSRPLYPAWEPHEFRENEAAKVLKTVRGERALVFNLGERVDAVLKALREG